MAAPCPSQYFRPVGRSKLKKWAELDTFERTFQAGPELRKGNWSKDVFQNNNPITAELGCGRGEYTVALARLYPERNFVGVDVKGARIWKGAKASNSEKIVNAAFVRAQIDHINDWFDTNELEEIWITFPDPQPQDNRARKRLTHPVFLERYRRMLKPGGLVHLKTDNTALFDFTLEVLAELKLPILQQTHDLYQSPLYEGILQVKTRYEGIFTEKGETIKYVCFQLT